jgi:hypothetical protein
MKKQKLFALGVSLLLFTGCSQPADPGATATPGTTPVATETSASQSDGFVVAVSETEKLEFQPTAQKVDLRRDTQKSALVLANYDFVLMPKSANSLDAVSEAGQTRVHIGLKGGDAASYENPLPEGEYDASSSNVDIYTFADGSQKVTNIDGEKGTIVISKVSDTEVMGSVDITGDGGAMIKGDFTAVIATEDNAQGGAETTPAPEGAEATPTE